MRPILLLFVIAAAGFGFILQKKDAPEAPISNARPAATNRMSEHNWMKHSLDKARSVAQNVVKERRENEVP